AGGARKIDQVVDRLSDYSLALLVGASAFQPVPMGALLRAALAKLEEEIRAREAEVTYDPLPRVAGDAGRLLWLVENLLRKALSARGDAPRVHLSAVPREDEWVFAICASRAAEPAELEEMFQPTARGRGSGLAVTDLSAAICRAIVDRHGGSIWTSLQPAGGVTIFFTLPAE
ncbi:MAG TPA: ATP-binding protein, partial [Candidatus Sulfopaludibacter sp.]|nr:ATP-binding protein [Candidatus Sulfopaludibacter sp.]